MPDIVNTEQEQAWNGHEGGHWARHEDRWKAVNEGFDEPLFEAAGITAADRVLDVGCGSGQTTCLAALRAPGGHALGLDLSAPMLANGRARARREGITNVSFERGDAQVHPLAAGAFDVAVSRFGVMFFADPVAAFANVRRALVPGGRLAFVCAADPRLNGAVAAMGALRGIVPSGDFGKPGFPGMFSLADPDRVREVLTAAGFTGVTTTATQADGVWGKGAEDAADFLLGSGPGRHLLDRADASARARARAALTERLRAHETADGSVRLAGTAWLVTARRPA